MNLRYDLMPRKAKSSESVSIFARLGDFWRYNNFYIVSLLLALIVILFVVRT